MTLILDGKEVEPSVLFHVEHPVIFEIVDGQYRVERLDGEADVQKNSPAEARPKC